MTFYCRENGRRHKLLLTDLAIYFRQKAKTVAGLKRIRRILNAMINDLIEEAMNARND